jgi:hypothetical protein
VTERHGARGDPELALNDEEMIDKASMLLTFAGCDSAEASQIVDGILGLTESPDASGCIALVNRQLR